MKKTKSYLILSLLTFVTATRVAAAAGPNIMPEEAQRRLFAHTSAASHPAPGHGHPASPAVDMSQYNLLNPVPRDQMRRFRPDNPLRTQNPFTVDPGHFQLEMEAVEYVSDAHAGIEETEWAFGHFNLKMGLLNRLDVEVMVPTYTRLEENDIPHHHKETFSGFGDLALRLKVNLWGNDRGPSALGLIPVVSFPTSDSHLGSPDTEFGLLMPFSYQLPHHLEMRVMSGVQTISGATDREVSFVNSAALVGRLVNRLEGYVEFWSEANSEAHSKWQGTIGAGLIYEVTHDFHVDMGFNRGVTKSAPDWQTFLGLNFRF